MQRVLWRHVEGRLAIRQLIKFVNPEDKSNIKAVSSGHEL